MAKNSGVEKAYQTLTAKFAERMAKRLYANHNKGGWDGCTGAYLFRRLLEEVAELMKAFEDRETENDELCDEAADVANFAMMIADLCETWGQHCRPDTSDADKLLASDAMASPGYSRG